MTEWKIPTRIEVDIHGKEVTIQERYQVDDVGNIAQRKGMTDVVAGVIPKACQKCKEEFNGPIKRVPVKQKVPFYSCRECNFENQSPVNTLDHKIETNHEIKTEYRDRIVRIESVITGTKANITKTDDDVIILCDDCNGS